MYNSLVFMKFWLNVADKVPIPNKLIRQTIGVINFMCSLN